ncbi:MAG: hypothetical protein LC102_01950 [Ignavibacteriales bacterium]|nr:MAG: hypothetical protein F9K26_04310 [Ignavibacteriaceae bacterium]MBV6444911.1 hypothetical protein [Ignavibacteriaceae bacterium]MBW7873485.1 hypothetical protein [Ignavibacteria bacterium]MCZ2142176.1 hypothetical protein [Ignavibacteriales bacterium]WKZ71626.1 MAG: hypothetical protein QY308_08355 [Ignavibacteriaceae bacterium]
MKTRRILTLIIVLIAIFNLNAEKRYVSKTGSSTPPYTSWVTAADSIMKAMNLSGQGDTIIIGEGVFTETLIFNPGVVVTGLGWEKTIIKILPESMRGVTLKDRNTISNLKVEGSGLEPIPYTYGIYARRGADESLNVRVEGVKVSNFSSGIKLAGFYNLLTDSSKILNSIIDSCQEGIYVDLNIVEIKNNVVTASDNTMYMGIGSRCDIHDNIFISAPYISTFFTTMYSSFGYPSKIYNNIIVSIYETDITNSCRGFSVGPQSISNNLFMGNYGITVRTDGGSSDYRDIFNNYISGGRYYGFYGDPPLRFNNFWDNGNHYRFRDGTPIDTVSNIIHYPMFVNETEDFHLQKYSPLIDAGDTLVNDVDGTRSDIGLYGGPYGKSYDYLDLAPVEPRGITAVVEFDTIRLAWQRNHESDFKGYLIYGDTLPGFTADSTRLLGRTADTNFTKIIPGFSGSYYLVLRSVDMQGNISEPSEEIKIVPVGVAQEGHEVVMEYQLFNNYPNPFNPETVIGYRLKSAGRVILTVYTITGEPVRVLEDRELPAGYHETVFRGDELASGIYLYKIDVRSPEGVPVFTSVRKMLLLK